MKKTLKQFTLFLAVLFLFQGCVGFGLPGTDIFQKKPWTLLSEGDEFGRDQLANRFLVASKAAPIKGFHSNTVLSLLGQPQEIEVIERDISEDWYFIYYKTYKKIPKTTEGVFLVRLYHDHVIDVISVN